MPPAVLSDLDDEDACEAALKAALKASLQEFAAFVAVLPSDLGGSHFCESASEQLADHDDTW